jgi:hypothetical protein
LTGTEPNPSGQDVRRTVILFAIYACMACAMRTAGQANDLQFATALIFPLFVFGLRRTGRPHGSTVSILKVVLAISILATLFLVGTLSVQSSALMAALWFGLQVKLRKARPLQYWKGALTSPGSSPPNKPDQAQPSTSS